MLQYLGSLFCGGAQRPSNPYSEARHPLYPTPPVRDNRGRQIQLARQELNRHIAIVKLFLKTLQDAFPQENLNLSTYVQWDDDNSPNAWFDPQNHRLVFEIANFLGDDNQRARFTRDLDIVAHEMGHAFDDIVLRKEMPKLPYQDQSGAIKESVADVFALMAKDWAIRNPVQTSTGIKRRYTLSPCEDFWTIGDKIVQDHSTSTGTSCAYKQVMRSFKNPGSAHEEHLEWGTDQQSLIYQKLPVTEQGDWGGVHINSGILNHIFYQICAQLNPQNPQSQVQAIGRVWLRTLSCFGEPHTFQHFGGMMIECLRQNGNQQLVDNIQNTWITFLSRAFNPEPTEITAFTITT